MTEHYFDGNSIRCKICNTHFFYSTIRNCIDKTLKSCCGGAGAATWNQTNGTWNCSDCGSVKSNDSSYIGGSHTPDTNDMWYGKPKKVCTCGSEKTYGPGTTHTSWCDVKNG